MQTLIGRFLSTRYVSLKTDTVVQMATIPFAGHGEAAV